MVGEETSEKQNPIVSLWKRMTIHARAFVITGLVAGVTIPIVAAVKYQRLGPSLVALVTGILTIGLGFLGAYNAQCTVRGDCSLWAWLAFAGYCLYIIAVLVMILLRAAAATPAPYNTTSVRSNTSYNTQMRNAQMRNAYY